ncbi:MAG: hypothetical protein JWP01_2285 [Myxococcales bacterium]|nr:hypothetical protein [Myxococcales bacterium]
MNRRALAAWAAVIVPLWIVMLVCVWWEPIVHDAWGNLHYVRTHELGLTGAWSLIKDGWLGSNPRLGQAVTTLLYAPGPYHLILTPVLELALFFTMTTLALGRWPSVRRADDALAFVTVTAIFALCTPQLGSMLFYRPFIGNYVFGLLLNVIWLVPFRFALDAPRSRTAWWAVPLMLVLGIAAGMCNEHTGPSFVGAGVLVVVWSLRRGDRVRAWMIAGVLGMLAGYVLLLLAPGHDARYAGLARHAGLLGRIAERGVVENVVIVAVLPLYLAWSVPWVLLGVLARRSVSPAAMTPSQKIALVGFAAAGVLATLALLGSPKVGHRLYVHSIALIAIALAGWTLAQLATSGAKKVCAVLGGVVLAYVAFRCVNAYRVAGPISRARMTLIESAAPGAAVVVPRYGIPASTWFYGEDLDIPSRRDRVIEDYQLGSLELAP